MATCFNANKDVKMQSYREMEPGQTPCLRSVRRLGCAPEGRARLRRVPEGRATAVRSGGTRHGGTRYGGALRRDALRRCAPEGRATAVRPGGTRYGGAPQGDGLGSSALRWDRLRRAPEGWARLRCGVSVAHVSPRTTAAVRRATSSQLQVRRT